MKNFFIKLFSSFSKQKPDFIHGAILPSPEDIEAQVHFNEMVAKVNNVIWKPLDSNKFSYNIRNQSSASKCVAQTVVLMGSIIYFLRRKKWIDFSADWIYSKRINKPAEGMVGTNAFKLAQQIGMLPDILLPSDNLTEYESNNPILYPEFDGIASAFEFGDEPILLPIKDIDTIASVMQTTGKPVMVWFDFGPGEWKKVPQLLSNNIPYRHSVTGLDFGIYLGKKAILIQDSWGKDLDTIEGKRIITEDFFRARNIFAAYQIRFKFDAVANKPIYDGSTKSLQECLKFDGVFPTNIESTGVMGNITIGAIKKFQAKYNISQTGTVGPVTAQKLKELFA